MSQSRSKKKWKVTDEWWTGGGRNHDLAVYMNGVEQEEKEWFETKVETDD